MIRDLRRMGLLREEDQIVFRNAQLLRYANIIFDLERADALKTFTATSTSSGSRIAGVTETGATCGRTRASKAESRPRRRP